LKLISIPTGTIKRLARRIRAIGHTEFQFLLVRLKVDSPDFILPPRLSFQFLLVRLKVSTEGYELLGSSYFNSYWYD